MIFSKDINNLIDNKFERVNELSKYSKELRGQQFGQLIPILPVISRRETTNDTVFWVCKCNCGNYYRVIAHKLYNGNIRCCPECNKNLVIEDGKIIRPINNSSTKTDEELIDIISNEYYYLFEKYIELDDFKQEIYYLFWYNKLNKNNINKSRTFGLKLYLQTMLNKIRYSYNTKTNIQFVELTEDILDINRFEYLDIYPINDKLNEYVNKFLTKQESKVIKYIYDYRLSIIKISEILNISKQRVSQIHHNAIKKLYIKLKGGN